MNTIKIHWHGFLGQAILEHPDEVCGFLFSDRPYMDGEEWHVFPVKNIAENKIYRWIPDRKDMLNAKRKAIKMGLVKIGNVHTHSKVADWQKAEELFLPSPADLKFARRFNDIVRGIVVCDKERIYGVKFHDKFGRKIDVMLVNIKEDGYGDKIQR